MTLSILTSRVPYNGDGVAEAFPVTFPFLANEDIAVYVRELSTGVQTLLALNTHYTVTGAGEPLGGIVTLVNGAFAWQDAEGDLRTTYRIVILRNNALTQPTDIRTADRLLLDRIERQFDRSCQQMQMLNDAINRCIRGPATEDGGAAMTLPDSLTASGRAGKVLYWDAAGNIASASAVSIGMGGFTNRAIPFASSGGLLTENPAAFFWNNDDLFLSVTTTTGPMTFSGAGKFSIRGRNADIASYDIFNPLFGGSLSTYDAVQGIVSIQAGSTILHASAVSGYIKTADDQPTSGVCFFGMAIATANNSKIFGLNPVLTDSVNGTVGALTGVAMENEYDFNVCCPGTSITGISFTGGSVSTPLSSTIIDIAFLNQAETIAWNQGFTSRNGACTNFMVVGQTHAAGNDRGSQPCLFNSSTSAGVGKIHFIQAKPGVGFNGWYALQTTHALNCFSVELGVNYIRLEENGTNGTLECTQEIRMQSLTNSYTMRNGNNAQVLQIWGSTSNGYHLDLTCVTANGNCIVSPAGGQLAFSAAALAVGATVGYMCLISAAGVSTGTPANIPTGQIPVITDSVSGQVGLYNGSWLYLPRTLDVNVTALGNLGGGTDDLISFVIPAGILSRTGKTIRITARGTTANNANAKTLTFMVGSQTVLTTALTPSIAGQWEVVITIIRTGSSTQAITARVLQGATVIFYQELTNGTQNDAATITVKGQGAAVADNDIVQKDMITELLN